MSDYTKVVIETWPGLNISVLDESGAGHRSRIAGPKSNNAGTDLEPTISHELGDRDSDEIRRYLRYLDAIRDSDLPAELHALTRALDRHRDQLRTMRSYGHLPPQRHRLADTRTALAQAAAAVVALLADETAAQP